MCDSGEFVGNLWAEGEGEGEEEAEEGRAGETARKGKERGGVLWALGGNLCSAFKGWGSYNHPFVTSRKR